MDQEVKKRWISALTSGLYAQGRYKLKVVDQETGEASFCCLGVLTDLHITDGKGYEWKETGDNASTEEGSKTIFDSNGYDEGLPCEIYGWSGITPVEANELATRNDRGDSFEEIAHYIGEKL